MYNSHKSQNSSLSSTSFQQLQEESRKRKLEEASRQEVAQMELRRQEQLAHIQEERLTEEGMMGAAVAAEPPALPPDTRKFLEFAETHRTVLNQILRQSTTHLADGPFAVLV